MKNSDKIILFILLGIGIFLIIRIRKNNQEIKEKKEKIENLEFKIFLSLLIEELYEKEKKEAMIKIAELENNANYQIN